MKLYLVRHGIAEDPVDASLNGRSDARRTLTPEGRERTNAVAKKFCEKVSGLDLILHSPYVRARETAEIFGKYFPDALLEATDGITPSDSPESGIELAARYAPKISQLMIVGHEPYLSYLASLLLSGGLKYPVPFKKAAIACFDWNGAGGSALLFLLPPKFMVD